MDCPYFCVSEYGVFDSNIKFPKLGITAERPVEEYELEFYTADCPGSSWIDGSWQSLKHGTFICAKPGQTRKSRLPFKCHYIHLTTQDQFLRNLLDALPNYFTLWQLQEPVQIFQEMLSVESADLPEDRLLLESCVCKLIRLISRYRNTSDNGIGRSFVHQKMLLGAEQYIRENLSRELTLGQIAAHCNISTSYFHSLFTEYFHKTPARFVLDCRISAAKTGLLADECVLTELAKQCGFTSLSYFCCKFKQVTGKTPTQYRKEMLGRLKL